MLEATPFSSSSEQAIVNAHALVFPSPFSIEATLARCFELRCSVGKAMPICAVIGLASLSTFNVHANLLNQAPSNAAIQIVAGSTPPYDAEHLAPILANELKKQDRRPAQVAVLVGDKPGTSAQQWQSWLSANNGVSATVSLIQSYERHALALDFSRNKLTEKLNEASTVVYFTSVDAVLSMKAQLTSVAGAPPRALAIHPNISRAIEEHLGWRVVEIEPGTPSLINWMQCQK
jgi:hypothetical protein